MSAPGSLTSSSPSNSSLHLCCLKNPHGPRTQHLPHPSYEGQSISLCPGMSRKHFPHQLGMWSACLMCTTFSAIVASLRTSNLLKMHSLGKCRRLLQWRQYFLTGFLRGHFLAICPDSWQL